MQNYQFVSLLNHELIPQAVTVETSFLFQIPQLSIIGLPGLEISEAKERIRSAIEQSGFEFPNKKVIINLSPSSVKKQSTLLDLAMALAILFHQDQQTPPIKVFAIGELSLRGEIKASQQVVRSLLIAIQEQCRYIIVHPQDFLEIQKQLDRIHLVDNHLQFIEARTLVEAHEKLLNQKFSLVTQEAKPIHEHIDEKTNSLLALHPFLASTIGISLSGDHHLLILGPKGTGKSKLFDWFKAFQPRLDQKTQIEKICLHELLQNPLTTHYRHVHASVKPAALLGHHSQNSYKPGEFALAHGGYLLADEFPEWHRDSRETFREPLESGEIRFVRSQFKSIIPSRFLFIANGNLCPCGGDPSIRSKQNPKACRCSLNDRQNYLNKITGPLLDRIDLRIQTQTDHFVQNEPLKTLHNEQKWIEAHRVFDKILSTQEKLKTIYGRLPGRMTAEQLEQIIKKDTLLAKTLNELSFDSLRDRHQHLRIALTLKAWLNKEELNTQLFEIVRNYRQNYGYERN
jgi:magnesium chelatase family protein